MPKRIKSLLFKPSFLSFLIAVSVILALPEFFSKYEIKLVEDGVLNPNRDARIYHADIDFDGNSEQINSYTDRDGQHAIQIFTSDGGTIDQWNLEGTVPGESSCRLVTGDFDNNKLLEIYVIYQLDDTGQTHTYF